MPINDLAILHIPSVANPTGDNNLISANIKSGAIIMGVVGKGSVVETEDATATSATIVLGSDGYVNGVKINGAATIETLGGVKKASGTMVTTSLNTINVGFQPSTVIVHQAYGVNDYVYMISPIMNRYSDYYSGGGTCSNTVTPVVVTSTGFTYAGISGGTADYICYE